MKIAFFTDTFYPDINGVARTLKRFTDYLSSQNIEVKVFAPDGENTDEYISANIHRFKSLSFFLYPECRLALPNLFNMKRELTEFQPDLIHVATPFNLGLCGVFFAKKLNIPLVGSYHTNFDHYLEYYDLQFFSKMVWKYMNWFHRPFRKLFVPSLDTEEQLTVQGFHNLEIWSRGVDCELYHPYYDKYAVRQKYNIRSKYLLVYVGRLAPEKNVDTLLEIADDLPPHLKENSHWLIAGDGPSRSEMEKAAPSNMTFTGFLKGKELANIYTAGDLFVFPSTTETFGNVVLESLASGTPVIAANAGGVKNIIKHGSTGTLCTPGSAVEFADSIISLLYDDKYRYQMGTNARNYALTQKWDTIFNTLLDHYSDVIKERSAEKYA
ncbi:glycosyltransferase family 4 protein [Bacillus mesophilum]|uniref:Glycosyltransferase family 1 protein n=1 Tax=Bacillus mesophilum TaxID=1071718 RepID=A0A7V7UUX0_9BACI|nr:glycosyltransferase family 1 protein [Bacillus mesophilum]KAB2331753.1 glycosyltransferase family 1 protein [Bacillus mesophilum]